MLILKSEENSYHAIYAVNLSIEDKEIKVASADDLTFWLPESVTLFLCIL
jgi:hypothetical protein